MRIICLAALAGDGDEGECEGAVFILPLLVLRERWRDYFAEKLYFLQMYCVNATRSINCEY
jgi:hypothetical protein